MVSRTPSDLHGRNVRRPFGLGLMLFAASLVTLPSLIVFAARPTIPELLPESTLVMIRFRDVSEFAEKLGDTNMGRMVRDPQIQPLFTELYGSANELFVPVENRLGLSLNDLRAIPQGELSFAIVDSGEGNRPAVSLFLDCGENVKDAERLLEVMVEEASKNGDTVRLNKHRDYDVQTIGDAYIVVKEGLVMAATSPEFVNGLLDVWDGELEDVVTLDDNNAYKTIMSKCSGAKGERPEATMFVDPMGIVRMSTRGNFGARTVLALLEPLGIYGLQGVGGSIILDTEDFESIAHGHVLLDGDRTGALKLLAFKNGDTTPERWAPREAAGYQTMHWDFQQTVNALRKIVDTVQGEGTVDGLLQRFADRRLDLDFKEDILQQLQGRVTHVSWMEPPARINSEAHLLGIEVRRAKEMQLILDKVAAKFPESMMPTTVLGKDYYRMPSPRGGRRGRRRPQPEENQEPGQEQLQRTPPGGLRTPTPCIGVIGDYLIFTDSEPLYEEAVNTFRNGGGLAEDLEYKLVDGKIGRHLRGADRCSLQFNRPEEALRGIYAMISSPEIVARMERQGANGDRGAEMIAKALRAHPLPPYEVIAKYLAPGGGVIADGPNGIHLTAFSLRRDDDAVDDGQPRDEE